MWFRSQDGNVCIVSIKERVVDIRTYTYFDNYYWSIKFAIAP